MVTPANVVAFFAQTHWGSGYGVVDQYHPTPHKGLDCGLFHGIVDVPAKTGGIVAAVGPSATVGHYVTVKRPDGWFDTYCHIVPGVKPGDGVAIGARLGRQATTQAEGGTAWKGQHTHLCKSRTLSGWAVWGYVNVDPTPDLIAVLTNAAGTGGSTIINQEDIMSRVSTFAPNIGYWPNGYVASYSDLVFSALKFWEQNGYEAPGTEGTVLREIWAGNTFMAKWNAQQAGAAAVPPVDLDALATKVAAKIVLPDIPHEFTITGKADAS